MLIARVKRETQGHHIPSEHELTNCIQQSPSSETDSHSASQEIPHL